MIVDMPREAKVGGGVWHEYILLLKKKKKLPEFKNESSKSGPPAESDFGESDVTVALPVREW